MGASTGCYMQPENSPYVTIYSGYFVSFREFDMRSNWEGSMKCQKFGMYCALLMGRLWELKNVFNEEYRIARDPIKRIRTVSRKNAKKMEMNAAM